MINISNITFKPSSNIVTIISVYKGDELNSFIKAIDSIFIQSKSSDIFLFRDGIVSTDVEDFLEKLDNRSNIKIFRSNENVGLAKGLNVLIEYALKYKFEYIARMDSDDISRSYRFEKQLEYLSLHPSVSICGGACKEFGASFSIDKKALPLDHKDLIDFSISRCPFIHPTVLFRSSVFEKGIRYPTETHFSEDMALWFELLDKGFIFGNLDDILLDYYLNENTIIRRQGFQKFKSEVMLRFKYMFKLKRLSIKNVLLISLRFILHLSPSFIMKFLYKRR